MGRVTYSDFKYWYENNGELQEIFSYKDTLKNYSRLPLHTVDKSIDAIVKRSFEFFSNSFSGNQDLIEAFFMIILLVIKKAMETPDAMKVVCVGGDIQWLSAYIDGILKEMHPDSECVFSNTADDRIDGCSLKVVSLLSGGSLPEKDGSTVVAVKGHEEALIDCYTTYDFGMVDVVTDYREGAVPEYKLPERNSKAKRNIRTVAAMTPHNRGYNNSELVKDIGLVPYLFYKENGCKVYLVGLEKNTDYPAKEFVSGTEMVELESYDLDSKKKWIEEMGHSIDCLMLFGTYDDNIHISKIYRKVNPYGVIYLALDANSYWINNIPRFEKKYDEFYENCDVISTATETLQKFIAVKWKMDIDVVRCGYYPVGIDTVTVPDFDSKKNEIVTVGRIGSKEKRNDILLEAFAKIAGEFPDWTLKLVGPVAEDFNEYIDDFFDRNPELKERVVFTGEVTDKKRLHEEFLASKIFALTSDSEGFPNVIPEAKSAGLALALTNIDVAKEATGICLSGEVVPTGDARAYAEALRKLCSDQDSLKKKCKRSFEDYQDKYDYKKIAHELYSVLNRADKKVSTNGPLISVIMPVKNNENFFPKAVQSILDQEYSNWELIIVEGISTDKTGVMADDYSKADDRISVIHADEWIYESLNIGISKAKGEYITFLNSDDLLMPDALITATNYLKCFGTDMFLFAVNSTECDENQNILTQDADKVIEFSKEPFVLEGDAECRGAWERIMRAGLLNNQLNVYKKSVIKDVRFRNDIFGADYFFNLQVLPKVRSFAYYPKCLYRFNSYVNVSGMNASVGKYYTYSHSMYNDFYLKSIELFATYGVLDEKALSMFRQIRIANFTGELVSYTYDSCKLSLEEKLKEMFAYTNDLRDMLIMEGRFEDIEELALKISYKLISESSEKVEKLVNIKNGVEALFADENLDIEAIHRLTFDYYNPAHIGVSRLKKSRMREDRMDNVFQARIAALAEKYLKGEKIYNALKENRPEGVDIIINPQHIGDTLWVCIFLDAYKKKFGCKQILAVVPEYQTELAQLFTQIDDVLGLTAEEITALQSYIGFNQLWYSDHIRYGFFHYTISLNNSGVSFNSMFMGARDHNFMNKSRREFLELDDDCIKNGAIAPNPPESASKYSNAVMILPTARTQQGDIPESFWKKMVDMIKAKGYEVYCNYNNLPYETLVEGTIPLSTKLVELYNLSRSFKRFIGFRSGILDLIALGEGNITCLHPTYMDIDGMVMERDANIYDHLYQLNGLESLQAYQYRPEWEDELLKAIVENI